MSNIIAPIAAVVVLVAVALVLLEPHSALFVLLFYWLRLTQHAQSRVSTGATL